MTATSPLLIEAVRAGCNALHDLEESVHEPCEYPHCDCSGPVSIETAIAHLLKAEPREAMARAWADLAWQRIKRRMENDDDCPSVTEGAKESIRVVHAALLKELGLS